MYHSVDGRRGIRGFTLIEILAYIVIFNMALVLCSKLFVSTSRLSVYSVQMVDRRAELREVQRDFLKTAHGAAAVVDGVGDYRTGEDTLVLRLHHAGETPRHAVLGMLDGRQRLNLLEVVGEGDDLHAGKYMTWRLPVAGIRFEVAATGRRIALAVTTPGHPPHRPEAGRQHRFMAALRVDPEGGEHHEQ